MPQNPIKGYTSRQQEMDLTATVAGIGTAANPEEFKDDAALRTSDAPNNSQSNGDNPSMPISVPFANGKDVRK